MLSQDDYKELISDHTQSQNCPQNVTEYGLHGDITGGDVTESLPNVVSRRSEDSDIGLQKVEEDWRDTITVVLTPCHCEHKEHVRDAGNTEQQENAGTEQVED